jgi:hypothetical protein
VYCDSVLVLENYAATGFDRPGQSDTVNITAVRKRYPV